MATTSPARRTRNVFASARRQQETIRCLGAIWLLRLVVFSNPDRQMLIQVMDDDAATFLGIQELLEDGFEEPRRRFSSRERKNILRRRLSELEAAPPDIGSTILGTNVGWLASKLRLNAVEKAVFVFAVLANYFKPFRNALESVGFACMEEHTAEILGCLLNVPAEKIQTALSERSKLIQAGLLTVAEGHFASIEERLVTADGLCRTLFTSHADADALMENFFRKAAPARLDTADFAHLEKDFELVDAYLRAAGKKKTSGVNILLYGPSGVGKTEFARLVGKCSGYPLYEVAYADRQGNAIDGAARFSSYMLCQKLLANGASSLVIFDEVEDVFPASPFERFAMLWGDDDEGFPSSPSPGKAWVNGVLENNPVPAIWITNHIDQIDQAYLRRFDLALEFSVPPREARRRIAQKLLAKVKVRPGFLERLANWEDLTPAQIEKAAKVARIVGKDVADREALPERILRHSAKLLGQSPLLPAKEHSVGYDLSFLNVNVPIKPLIDGLRQRAFGTFCFYGPPGTGKTALARHIANQIGKPLLVRRASDLLRKYVGETEQNIAMMFAEASDTGAVLLLDEADSFLGDRRSTHQSWEVTLVNELLTQMESFEGVFICTTNLMERLDIASLRRFAFKIRFDCLNKQQRRQLFVAEMARLLPDDAPPSPVVLDRLDQLDRLTPGDFAAVARQWALLGTRPDAAAVVAALAEECRAKGGTGRSIGFTA